MIILTSVGIHTTEDGMPKVWSGEAIRAAELTDGFVAIDKNGLLTVYRAGHTETHEIGLDLLPAALFVLQEIPLKLLIGTVPPHLFHWSEADGLVRNECFAELPCRDGWHTPWGGPAALRTIASPDGKTVYADIHVGSIMRSLDAGATWEPVTPTVHEDVHRVATCPSAPHRVYANTFVAVYVSDDQGRSWRHCGADLGDAYGREVAVHPSKPDVLLATTSDGPLGKDLNGHLWFSDNAGESWELVGGEFPSDTQENIDTHHVTFDQSGAAWACVGSVLYRSDDLGRTWCIQGDLGSPIRLLHCAGLEVVGRL